MEICGDCFWFNGGFCDLWIARCEAGEKPCEFFDTYDNYLAEDERDED